jgi:signal transduction histidine kinase/CheY-like chemotaxis protein/HPt (histidine-containing phosphotransfer) domain-containing protein
MMSKTSRTIICIRSVALCLLSICLFLNGIGTAEKVRAQATHKTVRVGYFENEIFQEGAEEGAVRDGYAYDYYLKISEYTGWEYEYVFGSFSDVYQMLLDGDIDLLAGLARTPEREGIIGYPTLAMGSETYNLVKHAGDDRITTLPSTLEGMKIAVLDSAMVGVIRKFLDENEISAEVIAYPSYQVMMDDFDAGATDVFVAESDGSADRKNAELLYPFGSSDYYLCVNINRQDLLDDLDRAQNQLSIEEPNYINSLRIKYYPSSISSRSFSDDEKEWLSGHNSLTIGYLNNYLPYSDTDSHGQATGLVKELVPLMFDELGLRDLKVTFKGYDKYDDMISDIGASKVDAIFPVGGGLYYSEENDIYQSGTVVSSSTELVYSGEYSADKLTSFAVNENNRTHYYYIRSNYPDAEMVFYDSTDKCLRAVLEGDVGCTTLDGIRANDILKNTKYRGLFLMQQNTQDDRCFGVKLGNAGLLKLLNRGISIVGSDQARNIAYRYVDGLYSYTVIDAIRDNSWLVALVVVVILSLIVLFLLRESRINERRAKEREQAGKILEEKNHQLAVAVREAEDANKAKDYFLSTMSHDIRTPMNSILSMNEMVLRESDNDNILMYAGNIQSSGKTLLGLINDILDFSKIEAGRLDINQVEYELSSVLNDLINMTQTMTEEKGLFLELEIDGDTPNFLKGDDIRIKQAVTNIITNAVKYTREGTVTFIMGYERIPDEPDAVMLKISIKDTGVGIREEEIGKIYDAFERLDKKNNRNVEGTGLGITITERLLNLMGSHLEVESKYGVGSTFSFSLKQQVTNWKGVGDFEASFKKAIAGRKKYREKFIAPDARILVVDDMIVNLTVLTNLLKNTRMQIDTAESGDQCIELARERKYDIIILDHMMPYKDGIETLRELRSLHDSPNVDTPAICLTANAISGMRDMYISAGFDDYLTKPIDAERLEMMLLQYLPEDKVTLVPADADGPGDSGSLANDDSNEYELPDFLYNIKEIDVESGLNYCGDAEDYIMALELYAGSAEQKAKEIEDYWAAGDIKNTTIKVHALKSASRSIGALELGEFAARLEKAGNSGDTESLKNELGQLVSGYRQLSKDLEPLNKMNEPDTDNDNH